jgi:ABC-type bacteriocin/lantibiotic exporter with double-glycine peptidase domain
MTRAWLLGALVVATGCATVVPAGRPFAAARFVDEPGWLAVRDVPLVRQTRQMDCGPAATAMLLAYWDRGESVEAIRAASGVPAERGVTAGALRDHLRARGLEAYLFGGVMEDLERELSAGRPVMVGTVRRGAGGFVAHYQVVVGLHGERREIVVLDPAEGSLIIALDTFDKRWTEAKRLAMVAFPPVQTVKVVRYASRLAGSGW